MNAAICDEIPADLTPVRTYAVTGVVEAVSCKAPVIHPAEGERRFRVSLIDYGAKRNIIRELQKRGCEVTVLPRVQKERFFNEEDYLRLKDSYILTPDKLANAKKDLCILHPLPRVNEISVAVDDDPRACYFKQAQNGRYIRMALIMKLLGIA